MTRRQRLFLGSGTRRRRDVLALDTMCFLYRFEANPGFLPDTRDLFDLVERGACRAVTSVLTVTEALTAPLRQGDGDLASAYRAIFHSFPNLSLVPVEASTAELAAALRARHGIRTPDALHLACALDARADAYVTADRRLGRIPEIEILLLEPRRTPAER